MNYHEPSRFQHADGWTDERVAILKELYAKGDTHGEIAIALGGGVTRNAVIGKVRRLGLAPRKAPVTEPKQTGPRTRIHAARKPNTKGQPKATAITHRLETAPVFKVEPMPVEDLAGVDTSRLIGLLALTEHTCKWPLGDPLLAGFGFCGEPSKDGSSYCHEHHAVAYVRVAA